MNFDARQSHAHPRSKEGPMSSKLLTREKVLYEQNWNLRLARRNRVLDQALSTCLKLADALGYILRSPNSTGASKAAALLKEFEGK
jgi:hypothetical protein